MIERNFTLEEKKKGLTILLDMETKLMNEIYSKSTSKKYKQGIKDSYEFLISNFIDMIHKTKTND